MNVDLSGKDGCHHRCEPRARGSNGDRSFRIRREAIALVARDLKKLEAVRDRIRSTGGSAELFAGDVTKEDEVAGIASAVAKHFGHPQILINNAGDKYTQKLWWILRFDEFPQRP